MALRIVLLGAGGVGRALLQQILVTRESLKAQGVQINVAGVFDSRSGLLSPEGFLSDTAIEAILAAKAEGKPVTEIARKVDAAGVACTAFEPGTKWQQMADSILALAANGLAVVDCSASASMGPFLAKAAAAGCMVVLANKKPITSSMDLYDELRMAGRRLRCEATCGAGLPILLQIQRMADAGDSVHRISGALSGTLGFVMTKLQEGESFSAAVTEAKSLGYTEPDPREDLSGMDVARKALILARALGWRMELEDVAVESLYPESMANADLSTFMTTCLAELDASIAAKVEQARESGLVLRYVATVENRSCRVGITSVPAISPLGSLRGTDNLVEISSRCYNQNPLVIQGAGAGTLTTASGVLSDIVDLAARQLEDPGLHSSL